MTTRIGLILLTAALAASCSSTEASGPITFCMQWANTSTHDLTFTATDADGDVLSTHFQPYPRSLNDAFAGPKIRLTGAAPITFSADAVFSAITVRPSGGNQVLIVEATQISNVLDHYEDVGTCP